MEQDYWQHKWESNEIGFNQLKFNPLMQCYFHNLKLQTNATVFVPLCGKSIDMIWLVQQGYNVVGVEFNEQACHAFFAENQIAYETNKLEEFTVFSSEHVRLFMGDFFNLKEIILGKVDAVYDRASLIALPTDLRIQYAEHIANLLKPHIKILLITSAYDQSQMQGPPFSVDEREINALFKHKFSITQLYGKTIREIPEHLRVKGLTEAIEQVHLLVKK